MSAPITIQHRSDESQVSKCRGINSTVLATHSELVVKPTLLPGKECIVPLSQISAVHLEAKSIFPPVTVALGSLILLMLTWGYGGAGSWPIRLPRGYDTLWSCTSLALLLGLVATAYRLLFASFRVESKSAPLIVVRMATKRSAARFVHKLSTLLR